MAHNHGSAERVQQLLSELQAAALCYGAVADRSYTDPRAPELRRRARKRLQEASKAYHRYLIAAAYMNRPEQT